MCMLRLLCHTKQTDLTQSSHMLVLFISGNDVALPPPNPSSLLFHLYGRLHGGHGLVDGGEGRDGRHENVVADQHVALDQGVCERGGGHCDVGGHLVKKTNIKYKLLFVVLIQKQEKKKTWLC